MCTYMFIFYLKHAPFVLCAVLIAINFGCSSPRNSDPKAAWTSYSSSPERKVEAAKALIPKGASLESVKDILGPGWVWANYRGPSQDLYDAWEEYSRNSTNLSNQSVNKETQTVTSTFIDDYFLEYPVTNGYVAIRFRKTTNNDNLTRFRYEDVGFMQEIPNELAREPASTNKWRK